MKIVHGVLFMRILLLFILIFPLNVLAVDNMMINSDIKEIKLQKNPKISISFSPGAEPGVVISPPDGQSPVIPGYRVRFKGVAFIVGVSCEADLLDDCSAYPYSEDYQGRANLKLFWGAAHFNRCRFSPI